MKRVAHIQKKRQARFYENRCGWCCCSSTSRWSRNSLKWHDLWRWMRWVCGCVGVWVWVWWGTA